MPTRKSKGREGGEYGRKRERGNEEVWRGGGGGGIERARTRERERGERERGERPRVGGKGEEDTTHRHNRQGTPGRDRDTHITQGHLRNRKPGSMVTLTTHVA